MVENLSDLKLWNLANVYQKDRAKRYGVIPWLQALFRLLFTCNLSGLSG